MRPVNPSDVGTNVPIKAMFWLLSGSGFGLDLD
jgi:hypothetical protein